MYHHFEVHNSDGNDNRIADWIVTADTLDDAWKVIGANVKLPYEDSGLGDDTLAIYEYWEYYDENGNPIEDTDSIADDISNGDNEGICYSESWYFQSSHDTLESAESECATYHSGPYYLEAEDKPNMRCNQCEAMMIQGVYCHETGCPNRNKVKVESEWIEPESDDDSTEEE